MTTDVRQLYERIVTALTSDDPDDVRAALTDLRAADIAEIMDLLDDEERSRLIYNLPPRLTAEVVVLLDEAVRGEVVDDLNEQQISDIVKELPPDDAADVMGELSSNQLDGVLDKIPQAQSDQISELLGYDETSAGGIMNPQTIALPEHATVGEAVERVRDFAVDDELHSVFVVDGESRLLGTIPLRRLVVNPPSARLATLYDQAPVSVQVDDDQEVVLHVMRKYDLVAVPVVDDAGRLVGRVTSDDVMDVAEEEAAEDIYRMAGTDAAELETHSAFLAARVRMFWLLPCMVGTAFAGGVILAFRGSGFSSGHFLSLVPFVPMVAATSGNAGMQVSAIIVRGFATREIAASKLTRVFVREIRIGVLVATFCAIAAGLLTITVLALRHGTGGGTALANSIDPIRVGAAVGLGLLCAIFVSVMLGIGLPFLFRRIGFDPAIASGPLITSLNDLLSVVFYMNIALAVVG